MQAPDARAILTRVRIPRNHGPSIEAIEGIHPELATEYGIERVAFLTDGIALDSQLMQLVCNVLAEVLAPHE